MAKNYAAVSQSIVDAIGGAGNVGAVTHCMTRLRFVLNDDSRVDTAKLKAISGVMGVVRSENQCQVIIGNTVSQAYAEVLKLLPEGMQPAQPAPGKSKITLKRIGAGILDALIGTMSPLIPAIIGGSMVKLLAMILDMTGVFGKGSSTLIILNVIGDGAFFFLPIMVAASAAVKFKTNMSLAIAIAGVLVHPNFVDLMAKAAQGQHVEFMGMSVTAVKYTYTVIPALCMTWILSYIEKWVDRITPAVTKNFLKPMLIVLISAPIAIMLIGPLGIWIGTGISALVYTVHSYLGWLSVAIMGALWPLLVMTGMHRVFTPSIIQTIAETGKEGMVMPSEIGANLSLGGSSLAVAWKTKNPELRQTALAAAASAIVAGISEPALYGVAVRLKRPLIAALISGFVCGAVAGIGGLASHSMASPGLFTSVQFFDPANPMSIAWVFGVMILAVVLSFVLTLILGFEDIPVEQSHEKEPIQPNAVVAPQHAVNAN
ncbi:PTS system arbutin/cellobiose/salicin-specific IIBC component [Buttiauxella ferragutiae ATCC 51602]|jgi:PTS system arbutin/cellobiose/salicin-specific IIC component|uniref:PTS system arbutin/cellobiose/salicin-specific IIBC component n=2 Tax=Buttiauxella TaxID=82976 RepID=A0ABX2WA27_9ENTR|nr:MULTISPECIES: PTS cellobiose/arbutin/salicin transporter subunit IIBC [Buttiauxella]AYN28812.1 PTS cellobiose/arbutin/salicin transporter subunit IIBC [Buttiauxella sp. 3AFRM03]MCE0825804.1 PTS cellobiose/arbutin/salicin transporter subunit IIBC [Buttiauxella ferragutiae]OAT29166.1 PTS system arbutin/cellobiose/salicin-specific IIBC component [Buttiauxella ferragutiae ATCC 51602]TDN53162.1 PTS system beta-glucoside-specific IIB component (Glc family) /PTS system beta-glucoside-specific IIC c